MFQAKPLPTVLIDSLYEKGFLSVRARNVCLHNAIKNYDSLRRFYEKEGDFLRFRNVGLKTNQELKDLCAAPVPYAKIWSIAGAKKHTTFLSSIYERYQSLTAPEQDGFNVFAERLISKLGIRAQNILKIGCFSNPAIPNIISRFSDPGFSFSHARNAGVGTVEELQTLMKEWSCFLDTEKPEGYHEALVESNLNEAIATILKGCSPSFRNFLRDHYKQDSNTPFPIWKFLDGCFFETELVKPNPKKRLLTDGMFFLSGTTDAAAQTQQLHYSVVPQGHPQITKECDLYNIFVKKAIRALRLLQGIKIGTSFSSFAEITDDLIYPQAETLNAQYGTRFTTAFFSYVTGKLSETHTLFYSRLKRRFFLAHNDLDKAFDFSGLFANTEQLFQGRKPRNVSGNVENLVQDARYNAPGFSCPIETNAQMRKRAEAAVKNMLFQVYDIQTDEEQKFSVARNTPRQTWEYIEDILQKAQKPLHIREIQEHLLQLLPKPPGTEGIRALLLKRNQEFVLAGLSTYGLKKWEAEGVFLGGTIKSMIVAFLRAHKEPKHVYDILKHIRPYRNTSFRSIEGIIKLDTQNCFQSFKQCFYGVADRVYETTRFNGINRHWFTAVEKELFEKRTHVSVAKIIDYAVAQYGVEPVQVEHLIDLKKTEGKIAIDNENMVVLV